jgi:hypothetical protein
MYCASDIREVKLEFSCKEIQKDGNNVNFKKCHNVLFNKHNDQVLNKGFIYLTAIWEVMNKINGLPYAYHKRIVCDDGITTKTLNIWSFWLGGEKMKIDGLVGVGIQKYEGIRINTYNLPATLFPEYSSELLSVPETICFHVHQRASCWYFINELAPTCSSAPVILLILQEVGITCSTKCCMMILRADEWVD